MSAKKIISMTCILSIIAGCVPSLHKLYTDDTLIFEPKLVGCWQASQEEQWCFTRHQDQDAYDLIITDEKDTHSFLIAHLVDLDGRRFLDLYPNEDAQLCTGDWFKFHLLGVHTFLMVEQIDPNLVMRAMQPDDVMELLEENPGLLKHEIVEDRVVLTAPTRKLQAFLENREIVEKIYDEPGYFKRFKPDED